MKQLDASEFKAIGQPLRRKEDGRLLTGKGRFTDDFSLPGQVYAVMVRCPHPHARIRVIDAAAARALPGVLGVFTGQDCIADGLKPIPHEPVPKTKYDMKLRPPSGMEGFLGPHMLLATDKARHVGEAVAMVVAETEEQALDAAEAVQIGYDELPFVTDARAALEPGAPAVWDEVPDNCFIDTQFGDVAATDRAFAAADHIVKMDFHIGRVTAVTMEPRAALGVFDPEGGRYSLHAGSGGAVRQKHELAYVLGVAPSQLRVQSYDVGGNFGSKNRPYVEYGLVLWASRQVGRPVKYTATRSETFLSDYQGRDLVTSVELALDRGGRFLALRADNISNVGGAAFALAPQQGRGPHHRLLRHPDRDLEGARGLHQHDDDASLPQLGTAESQLCHRAPCRHRRPQAWLRPHRAAPQNFVRPEAMPTPMRSACSTTAAPTRPTWTPSCVSPIGTASRSANGRPLRAASCSASAWGTT